ncbi:trp operon leader peptide [Streptomyces sp. NPDC058735]|uniref:trp operon leader peptide n=1 Tax=Streptomyces sp. NPDC058735 TaxID=3346616 RepID=UPI00367FFE98
MRRGPLRPAAERRIRHPRSGGEHRAHVKQRPQPGAIPAPTGNTTCNDARPHMSRVASCSVPAVFAHSIQTWWWTAHPAAH